MVELQMQEQSVPVLLAEKPYSHTRQQDRPTAPVLERLGDLHWLIFQEISSQ